MTITTNEQYQEIIAALPSALELVHVEGPQDGANDFTTLGLTLAHANWTVRDPNWCQCEWPGDEAYYRNFKTGAHGWMCVKCKGITQTG